MSTSQPTFSPADAYARLSDIVKHDAREQEKFTNTKRCYDPKKLEFLQFCKSVFSDKENPELFTEKSVYFPVLSGI